MLSKLYPDLDTRIAVNCRAEKSLSDEDALGAALTDAIFACPARRLDRNASRFTRVFAYEFADTRAPQYLETPGFRIGAGHTSELQYLFPGFHVGTGEPGPLNEAQAHLSEEMIAAWTAFARLGDPSPAGVYGDSKWQPYQSSSDTVETFTPARIYSADDFAAMHQCMLWDDTPGPPPTP